jgi:hypothetical protein
MRTFNTEISKQTAIGQGQGCIAIATKCERSLVAAQHLGLGHADRLHLSRRQLSQQWHGVRSAFVADLQNAWRIAASIWNLAAVAVTKQPTKSLRHTMPGSAFYGMPVVGLVPVAVRRLPVANAIGTPMPKSADC